jgi:hypothetical protein
MINSIKALRCMLPLVACVACSDGQTVDVAHQQPALDSAGVEIVTNSTMQWGEAEEWQVSEAPMVTLGSVNGDTSHTLWGVVTARRLQDGRIAVLSSGSKQVLLFDRNSDRVRTIGREGRGPGEFSGPVHLEVRQGTVTVWDEGYGPVTTFDTVGKVIDRRQIDLGRLVQALGPGHLSESSLPLIDGSLIARSIRPAEGERRTGSLFRPRVSFKRVRADFAVDSLGWYEGMEQYEMNPSRMTIPPIPLFPADASVAAGGEPLRIYITNGNAHEITVYSSDGKKVRIIRRTTDLLPVTEEQREHAAEFTISRGRSEAGRQRLREHFASLPKQTHHPAIGALIVDASGQLWARDRHGLWSVYDTSGVWLGQVTVPLLRVYEIGSEYILGLNTDDSGVEYVQEYRLLKPRREP